MKGQESGNASVRDADSVWRKIALVVASLDRGDAERLLQDFSTTDARRIHRECETLDGVDPDEQEAAIAEFLALMPRLSRRVSDAAFSSNANAKAKRLPTHEDPLADDDFGAVELDDSLARKFADRRHSTSTETDSGRRDPVERSMEAPRNVWDRLSRVAGSHLGGCLQDESPAAIAIVLARLPAELAAEALHALPRSLQLAVVERMSAPPEPNAEWVEAIGEAVWERTRKPSGNSNLQQPHPQERQSQRHKLDPGRSETLAAILSAADPQDRAHWQSAGTRPTLGSTPRQDEVSGNTTPPRKTRFAFSRDLDHPAHAEASFEPHGSTPSALENEVAGDKRVAGDGGIASDKRIAGDKRITGDMGIASDTSCAVGATGNRVVARIDNLTDLARLDESTLANLVTRADPWLFALALAGAEPSVARRWMERLGPTSARDIQRQLTQLGPWRLSDAVEAERRLVRLARELLLEATTPSPREI